jgi:hypothetical protein
MRFTLSALLAAALALPVLAQPPRGGDRERERPTERPMDRPKDNPDVERLMNRVKELEKQLAEAKGKKEDKKPEGDRKPEKETPEGRRPEGDRQPEGDRKPREVQPQPFPPREGPQFGRGPTGPPFGPMQPEGGNPFNPTGGPQREGRMGGGMMGGGMMGGGGMFSGMEALNKDEQEMFQKLLTKMRGAPQKSSGQGDRKPNVEERLERLENMMQKLMQKLDR